MSCNCETDNMPVTGIDVRNYDVPCKRIPLDGVCFCHLLTRIEQGVTTSGDADRLRAYLTQKNIWRPHG